MMSPVPFSKQFGCAVDAPPSDGGFPQQWLRTSLASKPYCTAYCTIFINIYFCLQIRAWLNSRARSGPICGLQFVFVGRE